MAANKKFKFTKEHADVLLDLGKQGASQKAMYAAIGISKDTAARLKKDDEFFAETMSLATTYGQAYWENMLLANIDNKGSQRLRSAANILMITKIVKRSNPM